MFQRTIDDQHTKYQIIGFYGGWKEEKKRETATFNSHSNIYIFTIGLSEHLCGGRYIVTKWNNLVHNSFSIVIKSQNCNTKSTQIATTTTPTTAMPPNACDALVPSTDRVACLPLANGHITTNGRSIPLHRPNQYPKAKQIPFGRNTNTQEKCARLKKTQ